MAGEDEWRKRGREIREECAERKGREGEYLSVEFGGSGKGKYRENGTCIMEEAGGGRGDTEEGKRNNI